VASPRPSTILPPTARAAFACAVALLCLLGSASAACATTTYTLDSGSVVLTIDEHSPSDGGGGSRTLDSGAFASLEGEPTQWSPADLAVNGTPAVPSARARGS
jgi:hypothetical protein